MKIIKQIFLFLIALSVSGIFGFGSNALAFNDFYSENDILFYDENQGPVRP
jgi:hypothetical protein